MNKKLTKDFSVEISIDLDQWEAVASKTSDENLSYGKDRSNSWTKTIQVSLASNCNFCFDPRPIIPPSLDSVYFLLDFHTFSTISFIVPPEDRDPDNCLVYYANVQLNI